MALVNIYSSIALEPWDWTNPWTQGIGGSETCHIELTERFEARGHTVTSYTKMPHFSGILYVPRERKNWLDISELNIGEPVTNSMNAAFGKPYVPENWLIFRDSAFFDKDLPKENQYFFIAQDVDYAWTPERLEKVSKYITLCTEHTNFTLAKYPQLKGKVFQSTNGVRREWIEKIAKENIQRDPNKIIYTSSPDRGLLLLLKNWFRIRERCPEASLTVCYGFDNMEKILQAQGGTAWFLPMKNEIHKLLTQDGVNFTGRIGQERLYREWFSSNIWWYPTDWPETSCINCMDAQACGAIPVTNKHWAVGENVFHGYLYEGIPQKDQICLAQQIEAVCKLIKNPDVDWREEMRQDALDTFSWDNVVKQYEGWFI